MWLKNPRLQFIQRHKTMFKWSLNQSIIYFLFMVTVFLIIFYVIISYDNNSRKISFFSLSNTYRKLKKEKKIHHRSKSLEIPKSSEGRVEFKKEHVKDQHNKSRSDPSKSKGKQPSSFEWCIKPLTYIPKSSRQYRVALASFPGSGNTWVRYLLQQSTGILTGSVYNDYEFKHGLFPGIFCFLLDFICYEKL